MEKSTFSPAVESTKDSLTFTKTLSSRFTNRTHNEQPHLRQPWRHSVSREGLTSSSHTTREFKPARQRQRLFAVGIWQWFITTTLCGLLAACLVVFGKIISMTVTQVKAFNALIVLLSILLGNNLTSSLREYALMLRWKMLASRYRSLQEFDLLMRCESLRKVMRLFWVTRTPGVAWFWLNRTQCLCALWLGVNILLQVLVALLGLTYNLNTSDVPTRKFGMISIANLRVIRDVWGAENPSFDAQLGSANLFGIQGQDYLFVNTTPPGQGNTPAYGTPGTATIYSNSNWTNMSYIFIDQSLHNSQLTFVTHRNITATATCNEMRVLDGGNGTSTFVTYLDENGEPTTLDVVRVGSGAMTYVGVLNSTCGPRCTEIMALQSADGDAIPTPSFFKCNSTLSTVSAIDQYLYHGQTADAFQMPDQQAKIIAGAIGWSGFNYTPGDLYQYTRYNTESWWSPDNPADVGMISRRIMEFGIEAVAAIDYNGPRRNVTGYYPTTAQVVSVQWRWSAAILGLIPLCQLLALICVIAKANSAIIRDDSFLSTARLLRPIVEKLGDRGCLLTGEEIADELDSMRVKYGWREPESQLMFRNEIEEDVVRHVDILEEDEGFGIQGAMPPGRYDGLESEVVSKTPHNRGRRSMSL
ncbi:hypothetical protein H2200_011479 [Cladophialophora chaetospira]|uniref:Uncharacterized protein n=1 Tax=Cladophialophora chaetospira TaxID=386627 RepID=A0AA38WZD9_9EURO|nr:hypothetical protein H2200_011479 [Cladophialophora chaetospira]